MKKELLIFALMFVYKIYSQTNLVPNPSFESYTACPTTLDQLNFSTGWSSYRGSPDYYNACNGNAGMGVPSNGTGYQAASTGSAYAAFLAYDTGINNEREIIGRQLTQTLTIGQTYYVSIRVSLAEFDVVSKGYVPCNKIGVRFSTVEFQGTDPPYPGPAPAPINNFAHIYTNNKISDTLNWITIKGSFIADSNYKFIMIGNFFDDANTDTTYRINASDSYFFVDDVCVSTSSVTCENITSISKVNKIQDFITYPNPAWKTISVYNSEYENGILTLYNSFGKEMYTKKISNSLKIDVSEFSEGIYYLKIEYGNTIKSKTIIIKSNEY